MTRNNFKRHNIIKFFKENLGLLGYRGKIQSLTTIIHEGVINALDAAEESEILPAISVSIKSVGEESGRYRVIIEDNGPGIPEESILKVFEMFVRAEKPPNAQNRGQRGAGIGISGAAIFSQATTGYPIKVTSSTSEEEGIYCEEIMLDVNENRGKVIDHKKLKGNWRGTIIELEVKDVLYQKSRYSPYNYLRMTAIANPHVQITFEEPDGSLTIFERATEEIPEKPQPIPPHPAGMRADGLLELAGNTGSKSVGTFLVNDLSRFSRNKLEDLEEKVDVNLDQDPSSLSWSEAEKIVSAFREMDFMSPPTKGLRPIGEENIKSGLEQILDPDFACAVTRSPEVYRGGIPFVIETGLAYGGNAGDSSGSGEKGLEIIRFANHAPLIFNQGGCALTSAVKDIDWNRYSINPDKDKITLLISIVSPRVPYKTMHNQSIAEKPEVCKEVKLALAQAARGYSKSRKTEDTEKTEKESQESTKSKSNRGSDTRTTKKVAQSEKKISDFRKEQVKKAERYLNEALNIYASYELAKSEDRHTNASVRLGEVGSKLWTSFYSITEAGINQELKDFRSLKKVHTEWLELPEKYYEMPEELRNYFYSGGVKERDYEKLEKAFNALTNFLEERLEKRGVKRKSKSRVTVSRLFP